MRNWVRFVVLGTMLTALVLPPAYARGTAARVTPRAPVVPAVPTVQLGFHPYAETEEESGLEPPPPPARARPAAKLPLCHEVTSVGVVIERARACSPQPR
jgi:hypothetical protein